MNGLIPHGVYFHISYLYTVYFIANTNWLFIKWYIDCRFLLVIHFILRSILPIIPQSTGAQDKVSGFWALYVALMNSWVNIDKINRRNRHILSKSTSVHRFTVLPFSVYLSLAAIRVSPASAWHSFWWFYLGSLPRLLSLSVSLFRLLIPVIVMREKEKCY